MTQIWSTRPSHLRNDIVAYDHRPQRAAAPRPWKWLQLHWGAGPGTPLACLPTIVGSATLRTRSCTPWVWSNHFELRYTWISGKSNFYVLLGVLGEKEDPGILCIDLTMFLEQWSKKPLSLEEFFSGNYAGNQPFSRYHKWMMLFNWPHSTCWWSVVEMMRISVCHQLLVDRKPRSVTPANGRHFFIIQLSCKTGIYTPLAFQFWVEFLSLLGTCHPYRVFLHNARAIRFLTSKTNWT